MSLNFPVSTRVIGSLLIMQLICSALYIPTANAAEPGTPKSGTKAGTPKAVGSTIVPLAEALTGSAKSDYENAKILLDNKDYASALLKFQAAFDASHDARLLWNMAVCEKQQRHYAKMSTLIERYLNEGTAVATSTEQSNARAVLETLQPFVSEVELKINEPDASVFIDDEKQPSNPESKFRVDMGPHKFKVTKDQFEPWSSEQVVQGEASISLVVDLKPERHIGLLRVVTDGAYSIVVDHERKLQNNAMVELPSGTHTLSVTGRDMRPYEADFIVTDKQTNTMRVTLVPQQASGEGGGKYTWLMVAGGVIVAGLATGAYFAFRGNTTERPAVAGGTMAPGYINLP